MDVGHLALALTAGLTAGLNLYLTVLTLGLLHRFEVLNLPPDMEILAHPWVIAVAGVLFLIEFVADKIPYLDNTWDFFHTFIRIPAGAVLVVGLLADLPQEWLWVAALAGGFVTFSSHGAKATTRLAVNSTPEPFTNWFLSLMEDGVTLTLLWLVSTHPYLALGVALLLLASALAIIIAFYQFFRRIFRGRVFSCRDQEAGLKISH